MAVVGGRGVEEDAVGGGGRVLVGGEATSLEADVPGLVVCGGGDGDGGAGADPAAEGNDAGEGAEDAAEL